MDSCAGPAVRSEVAKPVEGSIGLVYSVVTPSLKGTLAVTLMGLYQATIPFEKEEEEKGKEKN